MAEVKPEQQQFLERVRNAWGDSERVAQAGLDELWNASANWEHGEDWDDQANDAMRVGILAGRHEGGTPEDFVSAFVEKFSNEDEEAEDAEDSDDD